MQLSTNPLGKPGLYPCSTLRRVEPNATDVGEATNNEENTLQYPQTGRT